VLQALRQLKRPLLPAAPLDMRYVTRYAEPVILSICHKGLKRLYEDDDPEA
jgi:hypothetical protein